MNDVIYKDSDTTIDLTITDGTGAPIDINTLSGLVVKIFQKDFDIDKFSLQPQSGFRSIAIKDAANGIVQLYLNADNLNGGAIDEMIYYEVKTQVVNTNFDSGTEEKSSGIQTLALLKDTGLKDVSFQ